MRGRRTGATAAVLATVVALAVPTAGAADDPRERKRAVDARVKSLDEQADRTAARVKAASDALERAENELPVARSTLSRARAGERAARADAAAAAERSAVTRGEMFYNARLQDAVAVEVQARRAAVAALARRAYTGGDFSQLGVLLGARSPEELTSSMVYLQSVNRSQRDALDGLAEAERELEGRRSALTDLQLREEGDRAALEAAVGRADEAVDAAAAAHTAVSDLVAERTDALEEARKLKAIVEKKLAEQEVESRRLAKIIAARIAAAKRAGAANLPLNLGGVLALPAVGPITSGYGMRYHPILRRNKLHTGTDFGVPTGTAVRAAAAGEVLQVIYSGAYGRRVVVDHGTVNGANLVTTYNHMSRFAVRVGQQLTRGQILGYSGSTGWSTGPHLHFETLVNGRFVDPMTLLRGRR
ncbi:MAG: M23 family metallopeptidase [Sporichthyaceae bacterium]